MPSRQLPPPQPPPITQHQPRHHPLPSRILPPLGAATSAFSILLIFLLCIRKITHKRTVPSSDDPTTTTTTSKPPHRFSYSTLRRATNNFSPSLRLGQGGFGSVFHATLPNTNNSFAVKVMDSGSLQGEREFQNELFFASKLNSPSIITPIGFSSDRKHRRMLLIYEIMPNGNLQDALLHRKCVELMDWNLRFRVAIDVASSLSYLHNLQPPVIHGDVKPSNILLDRCFSAKLADFGLAWVKNDSQNQIFGDGRGEGELEVKKSELECNNNGVVVAVEDCGSLVEETESVTTMGFEEVSLGVDQSPESCFLNGPASVNSPETVEVVSASPDGNLDGRVVKSRSGKDWWWKQGNGGVMAGENGVVKDYVIEWIGTEIKQERPKTDWLGASSSSDQLVGKVEKKKNRKRLDWWVSLDEEKDEKVAKKANRRQPREWWKEEYCEELEKKRKKKKKKEKRGMGMMNSDDNGGGEEWWPRDEEMYVERMKKKKRSRSRSSKGSIDWFSGELFRGHGNSHDSFSGELPKSGGVSSTPSMRGTVCYVAPECGGAGRGLSEKSDVYSFGVLLLVLIAGRRPLQVTSSPMSEFQRANLIHWARHLARAGKLIDLVDQSVRSLDREQAMLCITVALLCLQKSPDRRPSMQEVVGMLTGESDAPQLPTEFSPSPPSRFPFKSRSRKKAR